MNILIVGSGAREHAMAQAFTASIAKPLLYCCGTSCNPGIKSLTTGYWSGDINDVVAVANLAKQWQIDLAVIGPEAPLEQGLADTLWAQSVAVIGPRKQSAQIETSKSFARDLMKEYGIAGLPRFKTFEDSTGVSDFLHELGEGNYVVKANGLMAGKGVKVAGDHLHSFAQALEYCQSIFKQKQSLLIEEKLIGQEFSFMCFSDGETLAPMPLVQDNKRAFDGDKGPNTGGMGSFSAADHGLPFLSAYDVEQALTINQQIIKALQAVTGERYIGILYGGFIATANGVYVIEFNARFGDPESLNVLSLLESDFVDVCLAMANGHLQEMSVNFAKKATVCKYAVPEGYPDNPLRDVLINIEPVLDKRHLYLAAVNQVGTSLYATGSRTAACVGVADSIAQAQALAEQEISRIKGPLFHRKDIGTDGLIAQRIDAMHKLRVL